MEKVFPVRLLVKSFLKDSSQKIIARVCSGTSLIYGIIANAPIWHNWHIIHIVPKDHLQQCCPVELSVVIKNVVGLLCLMQ